MDAYHEQLRNNGLVILVFAYSMNCVGVHVGPDGHRRGAFTDTKSA